MSCRCDWCRAAYGLGSTDFDFPQKCANRGQPAAALPSSIVSQQSSRNASYIHITATQSPKSGETATRSSLPPSFKATSTSTAILHTSTVHASSAATPVPTNDGITGSSANSGVTSAQCAFQSLALSLALVMAALF